ncbi:MAG: DUF542 domain-containing protein [Chitinophagaceae bacterium]|nr:DUF542 domain-containing protein [Chitinophagaceae bacterium]
MSIKLADIHSGSLVADIVSQDYRAADVFLKYGIDFCYEGGWSLGAACLAKGLDPERIIEGLKKAAHGFWLSNDLAYEDWSLGFLIDFIINVHHYYLRRAMPASSSYISALLNAGHLEKYPELLRLQELMHKLEAESLPHIQQEEEVLFPYIKQVAHAQQHREPYADLLVKTLKKPLQQISAREHALFNEILGELRELTAGYTPPADACLAHRVAFYKLKELDADIVQHLYLENRILFPRAIQMELDILNAKGS